MLVLQKMKDGKRFGVRVSALLLAFLVTLSAFTVFPLASGGKAVAATEESRYSNKVVSVLYDNSGSMLNDDNRQYYARYAVQMLMSLLGPEDELVITPMNDPSTGDTVNPSFRGSSVDLASGDRDAAIKKAMENNALVPYSGAGTPEDAVDVAAKQLVYRGMQPMDAGVEDGADAKTEYWLVILTDGAFDSNSKMENYIKQYSAGYRGFRTIYLTVGTDVKELTPALLASTPTKAYSAADPSKMASVMQEIANQLSGRYTADSADYTVNGNTVTIDLDKIDFAVRTVSVLAQNCGAKLTSATYNGQSILPARPCVIVPDSEIGMKNGYSGVFEGSPSFSGGKLVLTFDAPVLAGGFSVLVEPALYLTTFMEYQKDDGNWYPGDAQYINSSMKPGDKIRVNYSVYEAGTDRKISFAEIFGSIESKVTYAGGSYVVGEEIELKLGTHEISLAVSVMNGAYTMYSSTVCVIEENPTFYRVDVEYTPSLDGNAAKSETVFSPVVNDLDMTADQLADYTYTVTCIGEDGQSCDNLMTTREASGNVIVSLDLAGKPFGSYTLKFKITSPDGISRTKEQLVAFYPAAIHLTVEGEDSLSMSQFALESNARPFVFKLSADGTDLSFDNSLITYSLTVGGTDITAYATTAGDTLTFIPTAAVGALAGKDGAHEITLGVSLAGVSLSDAAKVTLTLTATTFEILPLGTVGGPVDRFGLGKNQTVQYFRVLRDGVSLPEAELLAAIEDGSFIAHVPSLPADQELTVAEYDGDLAVCVRTVSHVPGVLRFFMAPFIAGDERVLTVQYNGKSAEDILALAPASLATNFFDYVMPFVVIGIIIYTILFFALRPGCPKLLRSAIIKVSRQADGSMKVKCIKNINATFTSRLIPKRLIPFVGLRKGQDPVRVESFEISCGTANDGKMRLTTRTPIKIYPQPTQIDCDEFVTFWRACAAYAAGAQRLPALTCETSELDRAFKRVAMMNNENADPDFVGKNQTVPCPAVWTKLDADGAWSAIYLMVAMKRKK